ncbi:MAG TPA: hypothetical protein VMT85_10125 [Thermoanaerobaculia bacterium]|nr:hypothetical protein [Thermoanaerobaculia bacterium]
MTRSFEVRSVDSRVVETWVWDLCEQHPGEECHVIGVAPGNPSQLSVRGSANVIAEVARLLAERDATFEPTQTFQIILVEGSRGGGMDPTLPANATAALDDVAQFLPFDSFRLLDTALLISTRSGRTMLSGPDGRQYEAGLGFRRVQSVEGPVLQVEMLRVSESTRSSPELGEGESRQVGGILIDTSISLKVGETAVVGTSKLNGGDEALILLLTALPSP